MDKILCWICKEPATRARALGNVFGSYDNIMLSQKKPNRFQRCYCEKCFEKQAREIEQQNEIWLRLKRVRMFEGAMDKMERQDIDFTKYEEAIKAVEQFNMDNPDKFDSAAEIIAAIILIHHHIKIKAQYKVAGYQVDFLLPDNKVVLEIDGVAHKLHTAKDAIRDDVIRHQLGRDWRIIRISADNIYKKAEKLLDGINAIIEYKYHKH